MEEIFAFTEEHLNDDTSGVKMPFKEFLDKSSNLLMRTTKYVHEDSPWTISKGVSFRLEMPHQEGDLYFPSLSANGKIKFTSIKRLATAIAQYFSPSIDEVEVYTRNSRQEYNDKHGQLGYEAGGLGYESVAGSAQDFSRFINMLVDSKILSEDQVEKSFIYAKPNGHHDINKELITEKSDMISNNTSSMGIFDSLVKSKNIIVEGVAGSGKSHMLQGLRSSGAYGENGNRIDVVVFHPSTSYEEFVSGIRPNFTKQESEGDFVTYEGVFVQMCNRAAQNPEQPYLLFIDEINRANTSRVFGDLMLVLEKTKRQSFEGLSTESRDGALFEASVETMPGEYVRLQTPIIKNGKEYNKLAVPSNLHVLGTMNTTDRSVGTIDLALRRRFHWITQEPYSAEELKEAMGDEYPGAVASWYEKANGILLTKVGPDARLGHAYFFGKDGDEEAIAESLITQLLEIIFTFNIKDNVLQEIGVPPIPQYAGKKLGYRGEGLGRRPSLDDLQSSVVPQADEPAPDNSGDDSASENQ